MTLQLNGTGHFNPENEVTNRFLEDLEIDTRDEWIPHELLEVLDLEIVVTAGFGFGDVNACLVCCKWTE
jgi:hypothetical protein